MSQADYFYLLLGGRHCDAHIGHLNKDEKSPRNRNINDIYLQFDEEQKVFQSTRYFETK